MTTDAHKLQQLIQHINTVPSINTYSAESKQIIKTIYDIAFTANQREIPAKIVGERFSSESAKGTLYNSINNTIRESIQSSNNYSINVVLEVGGRTYRLFFVFPALHTTISNQTRAKHSADVEAYVKRIYIWLYVASHYASVQCSKMVDVYFYLTAHKKTIPSLKSEVIDTIHANTAFTTSCMETTEINLYRKEEMFKVFIHESFHNMGLDFSQYREANETAKQVVQSIFPVSSEMCIYETYCEMWAEIINVVIEDVLSHPRRRGFETAWPIIVRNINAERRFTMFQTAKILTHNGVKYADLMIPGNAYRENTEAFCYFVLKSIMMFHCDAFLSWCFKNNNGGIQFASKNTKKYAQDLIAGYYNDPHYVEALNKTQEHFVKNRAKIPQFIRNTLRMTIIE